MKILGLSIAMMLAPVLAQAACIGDLPGRDGLTVYADATSDAVVGGLGAQQCGLEVTNFCDAGRCLMFFDGLSGYVDVAALASGSHEEPPLGFDYSVASIEGALSFMGQTQEFSLGDNPLIRVEPRADHVLLSIPPPFPSAIPMTSTGSSGWEAVLPDWVGVPIPVSVYIDRVSARRATLEFFAEHQMLKMDMRLTLLRSDAMPQHAANTPAQNTAQVAAVSTCQQTQDLAVKVGQGGDQTQIDAYFAAASRVGITDWDNRSTAQCAALLVELAGIGIVHAVSDHITAPPDATSCASLANDLRPILRGPDTVTKQAVFSAMIALGVTAFDATNPKHCAEISYALGR